MMNIFEELLDNFKHALNINHTHGGMGTKNLNQMMWAKQAAEREEWLMNNKEYISAQQLLNDSFQLAINIYKSGYRPDYIVGIWRGGAPVGIAIQELLAYVGVDTDHICIRTSSYDGIASRGKEIRVHGLGYIVKNVNADDSLLIVDDVYDTGLSIQQVIKKINTYCRRNTPDIKIATPYFKPLNNQTDTKPDYYLYETANWLVFPHELVGLSVDEIIKNKTPGVNINFSK